MTRISNRHGMAVTALAVLAHLGVAAAVFSSPAMPGAQAPGAGGIEVSLGTAGGAPGSAPSQMPPEDATEVSDATDVAVSPPPESETADAVRAEPVQAQVPDAAVALPVEAPAPEQVAAEPVRAVAPPPRPKRRPEPVTRISVTPVAVTEVVATPMANLQPALRAPAPDSEPAAEQLAARPPAMAGAGGASGARDAPDTGDGVGAARASGGTVGGSADYMTQLQVWLQEHKEYPRRARRRRQEGMALLAFVMDRNGYVLEHRIRQSSGHALLDEEVLALIRRAEPLPPPPPEISGERIRLVVPVQFFLR